MVCGHETTKAGRSRWTEAVFPSIAPHVVVDEEAAGYTHNPDRIMITHKGQRYYTGAKATAGVVPRTIPKNYIETDLHEVLLRTALHLAMRESGRIMTEIDLLVLGLPVSGHAGQRARLKELGLTQRTVPLPKSLARDGLKEVSVKVAQCMVLPQPMGALRLAAQSLPTEDPIFDPKKLSMVVDPGYRTLDWLVASATTPDLKFSGSFDGGVSSILRELSQAIGYEQGTGSLEFDMVEQGLETGSINLGHMVIDMQPYKAMVPTIAGNEVATFLARLGNRRASIAKVFIAGGGADYYKEAIHAELSTCDVIDMGDPLMSNARGYWLSGCDAFDD